MYFQTCCKPCSKHGEIKELRVARISDALYSKGAGVSPEQVAFAHAMASLNSGAFHALGHQQSLDLHSCQTVVDIGGSIGQFSIVLARAYPHLTITTCNLPTMGPAAQQHIAMHGLQQRIKFQPLNFLKEGFPQADMVIMSMVHLPAPSFCC